MSVNLYVYVGPYLECQKSDFDEERWESIARVPQLGSKLDRDRIIVLPNCELAVSSRDFEFDRTGSDSVTELGPGTVERETQSLRELFLPIVNGFIESHAAYRFCWGVVPHWY